MEEDNFIKVTKTKKKRKRTVISAHEMEILESGFKQQPKPDRDSKLKLAKQLSKPYDFISVWFQNRRARERKVSATQSEPAMDTSPVHLLGYQGDQQQLPITHSYEVHGSSTMTHHGEDQEEPLDLSDSASSSYHTTYEQAEINAQSTLFGSIVRMAAAAEGGILAPDSPFTTHAITDACTGIKLRDGLLICTRELGFEVRKESEAPVETE